MVKETLGRNVVFSSSVIRDPQFASRDANLPVAMKIQAKCAGKPKVMLQVVLTCDEGVVLLVPDEVGVVASSKKKSEITFRIDLKHDEEHGFYVNFEVAKMEPPKAHLATVILNYLVPGEEKPVWNDCFDLEVNVVRNPALVGVKNEDFFEGLLELQIGE